MIHKCFFVFLTFLFSVPVCSQTSRHHTGMISGRVMSVEKEAVDFATVCLKGTSHGSYTDEKGIYHLKAAEGEYTLVVSAVGYQTVEKKIELFGGKEIKVDVTIAPEVKELAEVVVTTSGVGRVNKSAFNAVAVDAKKLHNSTQTLAGALTKVPGVKLRESGGVGSDMQLYIDGFSGRHIKIFIDGIPQDKAGTAFDLNNIPIDYANRIEVYKGVVPVGFGTDAIGGVVNIVTNRQSGKWFMDASYSYGSFNTHKSSVRFGQTFKNGFMYEVNAFQNFSDNDYYVDTYVRDFEIKEDGSVRFPPLDKSKIYRLKRFNDQYHNEAVIGKIGVTGKKWADRLALNFNYSRFCKEIQTGVYQDVVFGEKFRRGYSWVPSLEYYKKNLFVKNLDLQLTADYNHNFTNHVDTASRAYNWRGEFYERESRGEQSYQNSESENKNWNGTLKMNYHIGEVHTFTFSHVVSDFERTSRSVIGASFQLTDFTIPKITRKNVSGLSYRLMPSDKWNLSAFAKHYRQYNRGPVSQNADGIGNYVNASNAVSAFGYGAAGTYFLWNGFQLKLSYEKAFRLPTTDELFGDEDLEAGKVNLKPEKSDNLNLSLSYNRQFGRHGVYAEAGLIYRDTKDYIKRGLDVFGGTSYGYYENHGHVKTKGYNLSLLYSFSHWFDVGGTFNSVDTRDNEKYLAGASLQESMHYKVRMPNLPYRYANINADFHWNDLFAKGNMLTIGYDSYWQHEFPLYWENIGDKDSKNRVPEQFSHNLSLAYSIRNGRYNLSFECRNFTDARLFDNFSLQKAGRAFYGKFRVVFGK
ncbi:TonB-dependent receptor [uncultured Bacteroides sp.]|uniref:TonB-dependent receptor n=1 Tax=uncultured Bacteroides sp. TaxID=162156 RepID=UPI0025DB52F4|nr:TonB-dependent receptor [uncultured Bacteroides sp.]